jgi:hypothetical protein
MKSLIETGERMHNGPWSGQGILVSFGISCDETSGHITILYCCSYLRILKPVYTDTVKSMNVVTNSTEILLSLIVPTVLCCLHRNCICLLSYTPECMSQNRINKNTTKYYEYYNHSSCIHTWGTSLFFLLVWIQRSVSTHPPSMLDTENTP